MWRGRASDAMGISAPTVCCGGAVNACLGGDRGDDEAGRPVAVGGTGIVRRGLIDGAAVHGGETTSMVIAGRESAQQKCRTGVSPRIEFDHDVSILITAVDAGDR